MRRSSAAAAVLHACALLVAASGAPGQPALAVGAIALGGGVGLVLDLDTMDGFGA